MAASSLSFHGDPGVQPERTVLSWDRTLLLLVTAAAFSLRWLDYHGAFVMILFGTAVLTALGISVGQRRRYRTASEGIAGGRVAASVSSTLTVTIACAALALVGLLIVLVLST